MVVSLTSGSEIFLFFKQNSYCFTFENSDINDIVYAINIYDINDIATYLKHNLYSRFSLWKPNIEIPDRHYSHSCMFDGSCMFIKSRDC